MCNQQPHPYKDLIIAWANGAKIEVKDTCGYWNPIAKPTWGLQWEYRIKPEPKPVIKRWLWVFNDNLNNWHQTAQFRTDEEAKKYYGNAVKYKKLPWTEMEFEE